MSGRQKIGIIVYSLLPLFIFLVSLNGCSGRGAISGAVPTSTANSLIGQSRAQVIETLGEPDASTPYYLQYAMNGGGTYSTPATARTVVIAGTAYTTFHPSSTVRNCVWTFNFEQNDKVISWVKKGDNCATIY